MGVEASGQIRRKSMTLGTESPKKSRVHTIYKLEDGTKIPGVTTVLGILNKPALVKWANNLGLQGIDSTKYRDEMANIGTLAHQMIVDYFNKIETDTADYSKNQIGLAENCLLSFWEWEKANKIEVVLAEQQLISEELCFGGTIDLYCKLDGIPTLIDFKTGKGLYPEHTYQVAAYGNLLMSNGYDLDNIQILRIGRDEDEGFEVYSGVIGWQQWDIFKHCLAIYNLQKDIRKEKK